MTRIDFLTAIKNTEACAAVILCDGAWTVLRFNVDDATAELMLSSGARQLREDEKLG